MNKHLESFFIIFFLYMPILSHSADKASDSEFNISSQNEINKILNLAYENNVEAIFKLGNMFERGIYFSKNIYLAHSFYNIASSLGSKNGNEKLAEISNKFDKYEIIISQKIAAYIYRNNNIDEKALLKFVGYSKESNSKKGVIRIDKTKAIKALALLDFVNNKNVDKDELSNAIIEFQEQYKLKITGKLDEQSILILSDPQFWISRYDEKKQSSIGLEKNIERDTSNDQVDKYVQLNSKLEKENKNIKSKLKETEEKLSTSQNKIKELEVKNSSEEKGSKKYYSIGVSCDLINVYKDKGSGGAKDVSVYNILTSGNEYILGGYIQLGYEPPNDCGLTIIPGNGYEKLFKKPSGWEKIWDDKGSGANMDGSFWRGLVNDSDFMCLGTIGQTGYEKPNINNYVCLHQCLVDSYTTLLAMWTDKGTNAEKEVSFFKLPKSKTFHALPSREDSVRVKDLHKDPRCD